MNLITKKRIIISTILLAISIAIISGLYIRSPASREAAPNMTLSLLDGTKPKLADYQGRVVLISFWSVSCKICIEEMPHLNALHKKLDKKGLAIIGLNMPYDRPDWTVSFAKKQPILYPVSFDLKGEISRAFGGILATPTTVLIDKRGKIVWKKVGRNNFENLEKQIITLIKET